MGKRYFVLQIKVKTTVEKDLIDIYNIEDFIKDIIEAGEEVTVEEITSRQVTS